MIDNDSRPYARDPRAEAKAAKAYAKATRPWYRKKRFWLLGIIVLIVLFVLLGGGDDEANTGTTGDTGTSQEAPAAPEPAMTVTAQQMIEDLEANALGASETYKGKRVTVTGKVSNIDASGDYFTITGTDDFTLTSILVNIEEEHLGTVGSFTEAQDVTVTGTVSDVGEVMGYVIDAETVG